MRQAVEAQVLSPHCELGEQGLRQVLSDVLEEVRRTLHQDIDGAQILHSLLNAPWLQSLLKVYECLQRFSKRSPAPTLDSASGLSLQVLIEIRALQDCSEDAKELYRLMRQPHVQAVLSAHDSVAQKDYEPVLPALPEELPDDEEATRIVCLVKNKQPLFLHQNSCRASFCHSLTRGFLREGHPAPLLCGSFLIDHVNKQLDSDAKNHHSGSICHWRLSQHSCPQIINHQPPQTHSAPPSPVAPRRMCSEETPQEQTKQEGLTDLRATVQQAVTSMESNTQNLQMLVEKMTSATEHMSRTMRDSSTALVQLTQEVDRLQMLLASKGPSEELKCGASA